MLITDELTAYREALEELLFVNPTLGSFARSMGEPVFDFSQETAYVTYDGNEVGAKRIKFAFNPDFLLSIDTEVASAVIAHEAHHVILEHLEEMANDALYPHKDILVKAHECIINDRVENILQMQLPSFVLRGMDILGEDCSPYSTQQVYDKLDQQREEESEGSDGEGTSVPTAGAPSTAAGADSSDDDNPSPTNSSGPVANGENAAPRHFGCGGVKIDEADIDAFSKAVANAIGEVAEERGETVEEVAQELSGDSGGGFSLGDSVAEVPAELSSDRMNWKYLLARINPKILDSGRRRSKTRNNWTTTNRRMASIYPEVILPVSEPLRHRKDDRGDTIPTLVIALDLSGSIDRKLVKMLTSLLEDIPKDLIRAFPCTWGSNLVIYDPQVKRVCGGSDTRISLVSSYVSQIKRETKTDPYVLVITDGIFDTKFARPGNDWYFMAVDDASVVRCLKHGGDAGHYYHVRDFKSKG